MSEKYMIVGNGAREHAIATKLMTEGQNVISYQTRPNIGLRRICSSNIFGINYDARIIVAAAKSEGVDVIIPGVEQAIFNGISDTAEQESIFCYAPKTVAARLESDKLFAKKIVSATHPSLIIPYMSTANEQSVIEFAQSCDLSVVLKSFGDASQLAVSIIRNKDVAVIAKQAQEYINASGGVIAEKFVIGQDFSVYCFTDGNHIYFPKVVRDYPFKLEKDTGEKTGGMGCVSANGLLPYITNEDYQIAIDCIGSTLRYLKTLQIDYKGILVGQFIKGNDGSVYFNEYDVRPGDPEIINVLASLDSKFTTIVTQTKSGTLEKPLISSACVVSICHTPINYPNESTPQKITIPEENDIFLGDLHQIDDTTAETGKGRSFVVVGTGFSVEEARQHALTKSNQLPTRLYYRRDIGKFAS